MKLTTRQTVAMLEAAYRVEQSEQVWLEGVLDEFQRSFEGRGWCAYFVDASGDDFRDWGFRSRGRWQLGQEGFKRWSARTPTALKKYVHRHAPCNFGTHIPPPPPELLAALAQTFDHHHERELLGLNALDAEGRGCALVSALPAPVKAKLPGQTAQLFERVVAHLATGARVLRRLHGSLEKGAEAIVAPGGRIEHAEGEARAKTAREALREAAVAIDRARTRTSRLENHEVTEAWEALVAGRWSLVDHFDRDGRRYFVVRRNSPEVTAGPRLSARESAVVSAASIGHSNKLIAYELGISPSTVATLLRRAAGKLGARTRLELFVAFAQLHRG